ncbi:DUF5318 family protein [Actinomadura sp. GTD37]|uniref:DUF5318 family protein n=1 Tax=Actinomadura sp. GTD37 TaxID=1778030 RepID=UPI0035C0AFB5
MYRVNVSTRYIAKIRTGPRPGKWTGARTLPPLRTARRGSSTSGAGRRPRWDAECGEFRVYVAEVCQSCGWNHLAMSSVLGYGERSPGRQTYEEGPAGRFAGGGVDRPGRTPPCTRSPRAPPAHQPAQYSSDGARVATRAGGRSGPLAATVVPC